LNIIQIVDQTLRYLQLRGIDKTIGFYTYSYADFGPND